jgi:hypothetical protein
VGEDFMTQPAALNSGTSRWDMIESGWFWL